MASQISVGEENALRIRAYGEHGSLEWSQQEPNSLWLKWSDKPTQMLRTSGGYLSEYADANSRTPGGHPEGYLEAFANHYANFAATILAKEAGEPIDEVIGDFPTVVDGIRGMAFIETVVKSSNSHEKWTELPN